MMRFAGLGTPGDIGDKILFPLLRVGGVLLGICMLLLLLNKIGLVEWESVKWVCAALVGLGVLFVMFLPVLYIVAVGLWQYLKSRKK